MNATCDWIHTSALPVASRLGQQFAQTWVESLELRIVIFTSVILCCIMSWVTSMTREIVRAATTVLCTQPALGSGALAGPLHRTAHSAASPLAAGIRHKTDGGPPPGDPPPIARAT